MQILDSDIMNWNNRIPNRDVWVSAHYSTLGPDINIIFKTQPKNPVAQLLTPSSNQISSTSEIINMGDYTIDYKFTFSVAKERENEFNEIFDKLKNKPLRNKVQKRNGTFDNIKIDINPTINKSTHKVYNTEYTRFEYEFKSEFYSSVIAYVFLLETSIELFSMIWGYDEDGNEHNLLKFPVGSIVSKPSDKSKDYLILDLEYSKVGGKPEIRYNICEMLYTNKSSVIQYGEISVEREDSLCWSRTGRIDDILG